MDFLVLFLLALFGATAHWYKKYIRKEISSTFIEYLKNNKKHTIASLISILSGVVGMYQLSDVEINKQILSTAFLLGYNLDSVFNKA